MRSVHSSFRILGSLLIVFTSIFAVQPASAYGEYALSNGYFFTQAGDRADTGFAVRDAGLDPSGHIIRFWSEFQRLGGVASLGYPLSRVYRGDDGFSYQLFQRGLLQWRPDARQAVLANILDDMSATGADQWLAERSIPLPVTDDGSQGNFAAAAQTRLGWLTEPHIRSFYLSAGGGGVTPAIESYGLPTSLPVRNGPFVVQRFQRVVLQLWVDKVASMPAPGTVVPVLIGDLYRERALTLGVGLSDNRFVSESLPGSSQTAATPSSATVANGLQGAVDLLATNPAGARVAAALRTPGVTVQYANVPAIALFSPADLSISVSTQWQNADPKALATVLAHEGSHLSDFLNSVDMVSPAGCYGTEINAFETQANVWAAFYGPTGKVQPTTTLDSELNRIIETASDHQDLAATVYSTYRPQCGG